MKLSSSGAVSASITKGRARSSGPVAIHYTHRLGAVVAALFIALLGTVLVRRADARGDGAAILAALACQIGIGIGIVLFGVPLWLAVAHNGVAALLLVTLINAQRRIWQR
jgi:cytochrome c oxidase assembly protein subunit 15